MAKYQQLNNLQPGTRYTHNRQDGKKSQGFITRLYDGSDGVDTAKEAATLARGQSGTYPGTVIPLKQSTVIKKDGGIAHIIDEYGFTTGGKDNPAANTLLMDIKAEIFQVDWYDRDSVVEHAEHTMPVDEVADENSKEKYKKPVIVWRIDIPFVFNTPPFNAQFREMTGKINKTNWKIVVESGGSKSGLEFKKYTALSEGAKSKSILQDDGSVIYVGVWHLAWREDGWWKIRKTSEGIYIKMLMFDKSEPGTTKSDRNPA
jgi:hypothetical protein